MESREGITFHRFVLLVISLCLFPSNPIAIQILGFYRRNNFSPFCPRHAGTKPRKSLHVTGHQEKQPPPMTDSDEEMGEDMTSANESGKSSPRKGSVASGVAGVSGRGRGASGSGAAQSKSNSSTSIPSTSAAAEGGDKKKKSKAAASAQQAAALASMSNVTLPPVRRSFEGCKPIDRRDCPTPGCDSSGHLGK